ncbi:MAG: hypothetical protein COY98_00955 [Candidatus Yonathbacteria bacterium CG_4_10_14_0_8_um_filter_43_17]|uniref:Uncharacterized protein n=1 Tax=Candidatus Yonathbacteria bacterium CG_4_10_14_0_8_um_filter_43_17 TaxID=1975099 RepID=A0A2M7Q5D3_9BACT|nr:MAG: hypothetical protein COY98_00955 [Candidatus Yonathbacteria bacterium CG_4_10_14_0_8_um_filter_43_17]
MQLADEHIKEFQVLYQKHFGVAISTSEALEKGIQLIRLMEIVLKHEAKKRADEMVPSTITK